MILTGYFYLPAVSIHALHPLARYDETDMGTEFFQKLDASILEHGVKEPLVVLAYRGTLAIKSGCARHFICSRHPERLELQTVRAVGAVTDDHPPELPENAVRFRVWQQLQPFMDTGVLICRPNDGYLTAKTTHWHLN